MLIAGVTATCIVLVTVLTSLSAANTGEIASDYPGRALVAAGWVGAVTFVILLFWLAASAAAWRRSGEKA